MPNTLAALARSQYPTLLLLVSGNKVDFRPCKDSVNGVFDRNACRNASDGDLEAFALIEDHLIFCVMDRNKLLGRLPPEVGRPWQVKKFLDTFEPTCFDSGNLPKTRDNLLVVIPLVPSKQHLARITHCLRRKM